MATLAAIEIVDNLLRTLDDVKDNGNSKAPTIDTTFHFVGIDGIKSRHQYSTIELFENLSAVSIPCAISLEDKVSSLVRLLETQLQINNTDILILYSHLILTSDKHKHASLKEVGVTDNACFMVAIHDTMNKTHGSVLGKKRSFTEMMCTTLTGSMDDGNHNKRQKLSTNEENWIHFPIQRGVSLDVITQEENTAIFRMPFCHHSMAMDSLYDYMLSQYADKHERIKCPHTKTKDSEVLCQQEWEYPLLKQYLWSKEKEDDTDIDYSKYAKLEIMSARNVIGNKFHLQRCKACNTVYFREKNEETPELKLTHKKQKLIRSDTAQSEIISFDDDAGNKKQFETLCVLCSNVFCWACSEQWTEKHLCDESFRVQTLKILETCATKSIEEVSEVPSIRACPGCCTLIYHVEACKHMWCSHCKIDFCFVCLKKRKTESEYEAEHADDDEDNEDEYENDGWPCGDSSDVCPVHSRQTEKDLHKLIHNNVFQLF